MNVDALPFYFYIIVTALGTVGWLALIVLPRSRKANFWFSGLVVPLTLSLIYIYFLLTFWFRTPVASFSEFFSLGGLAAMLSNPGLLLVAWINIIGMDLVVGSWMARKAAQIRMPYIYLLPCLILTFIFAGFGFTLFSVLAAIGGGWSEIAKFEGQPPTNVTPIAVRPARAEAT